MKTKRFDVKCSRKERERLILKTDHDRKIFLGALRQIPEPNPVLKELLSR